VVWFGGERCHRLSTVGEGPNNASPHHYCSPIDHATNPDLDLDALAAEVAAMLPEASEIALRWFRSGLTAEDKGGADGYDPVTIADRNIEAALRARITTAYPDHEVVGEEAGSSGPPGRYRWLIDPIDGTKAFVTGSPLWGTLIGLLDDGRPVAGWIHQPYLEETFVGIAGRGAWMDRRETHHQLRTRHGVKLDDAIVYCTTPTMFTDADERALFDAISQRARLVRYGGDCYAYAQLAMGHVDVVVDTSLKPYDIVAPIAVIEAAGGVVIGGAGRPASDGGFVVATGSAELAAQVGDL
jgi:histidinol phosphatase-like enzyme (inositol monophosphatase family)